MTTRRDILKLGAGATAAAAVTALPIPGITPVKTLMQLAADGIYASSDLQLPDDVHVADWKFWLNGRRFEDGEMYIKEIYAPGDDTGWAVVYDRHDDRSISTTVVRGNWRMKKTPRTTRSS